ncbi:DNA repair protein RecO [Streptococcus entericus]|uniref:DNA repair protein RecO n=1 Tax=Streptococcus entericus TaxID=155680 RepID=UPI000375C379|nr:DNA repair protein RecO [Streptococcus entericus]
MELRESRGLILYNRNYREDDKLVKIFTEQLGKRMFFVRHASQSKLASVIQPLTVADFILKINETGLSYIEDYRSVQTFKRINDDIFLLAHATYIVALADAAIVDNVYDSQLFAFTCKTLELMEEGMDHEVLTNIFEIQLLDRLGVQLNFNECVFCHRVGQAFDFSFKYSGLICPAHYHEDDRRSHLDPNVPYLLNRFQAISFDDLQKISLSPEMKAKLRLVIDQLYEDYVGIKLKSKTFIDDLQKWGDVMKNRNG